VISSPETLLISPNSIEDSLAFPGIFPSKSWWTFSHCISPIRTADHF
jgi:hypothetical protein